MDKKYLASLPFTENKPTKKERLTAEIVNTKSECILVVRIYTPGGQPQMSIFLSEKNWHTLNPDGKWSRQTLSYIRYNRQIYYYTNASDFVVSATDNELITRFYKDCRLYEKISSYNNSAVELIERHMNKINRNISDGKSQRAADFQKAVFAKIPDLPFDIDKWVSDYLLPQSRYMLMAQKSRKSEYKQAYCTHCEQVVEIGCNNKHNQIGYCPCCHSGVIYKSSGLVKNGFSDSADFYILQRVTGSGNEIFIRFFTARKPYSSNWSTSKLEYSERARYYFTAKKAHMWKQDFSGNWASGFYKCKKFYSLYNKSALLYNSSVDELLSGSCIGSIALDEIMKLKLDLDIINYIKLYQKYPVVEYFIKSGLSIFSNELINEPDYLTIDINRAAATVHEALGVTRQDLRLIKKYNCNIEQIRLLCAIRANNHYLDEDDFCFLLENTNQSRYSANKRLIILEYCTPKQIVNYLNKQMRVGGDMYKDFDIILSDWYDYLMDTKTLEYDMTNQSIVRPGNLNERHALTSCLIAEKSDTKINTKIAARSTKLEKKYSYNDGKYCIVVPRSVYDITHEGAMQSHCVGGYASNHANEDTTILFLRKIETLNKSFYTIEIKGNFIVQCRGYKNKDDSERLQVDKFIEQWQSYLKKPKKKIGAA